MPDERPGGRGERGPIVDPSGRAPREDAFDADAAAGDALPGADAASGGPDAGSGALVAVPGGDQRPPVAATGAPSKAAHVDEPAALTRVSAAWAAIIAALLLSVVLIVFVLQNSSTVEIQFLGWSGTVSLGMAMLIAAVTGGLLVASVAVARLTQLRIRARRTQAASH